MNKTILKVLLPVALLICSGSIKAQMIQQHKVDNLDLIYFGKRYTNLVPHVSQTFRNAMRFHSDLWGYRDTTTYVILNDFQDMGHGGALIMPFNQVQLGIEPYSFAFSIIPSSERFQWLFNHELTHVVMADKPNKRDLMFRRLMMGKIRRDEEMPLSAVWSYLTAPRWYSPRWYHEGIACFMETWMSGGLGRAMGNYDEMYFRSIINEEKPLYSLVGLETEGTTIDFQVGANSYLYGTRFVSYLADKYGIDKLLQFYNRSDDSKSFYAGQFRKVYGKSVRGVWNDWKSWENEFQKENIATIKEYPLTEFNPVTAKPLGSVSRFAYNGTTGKIYAAVNHPGAISQVVEIDRYSGKIRKLAVLDSPELYYTTHLAYDQKREKLFITENNAKYRSLVEIDIKTGKKRILKEMTRTGELVFNGADNSIWGVQHDNGYSILVMIPEPYDKVIPMYTAPFGKVFFDLDISGSGEKLIASLSGVKGEQSLVMIDIKELEKGKQNMETLYSMSDNTLSQFKFADNDSSVVGTSYYTGVSNVWRINLSDKRFELLSNTETGMFMPVQISRDSLIVLKFHRDGMIPGTIPAKVIEDANAISFLGNRIHEKCPMVEKWSLPPASRIDGDTINAVESSYSPLKEMRFSSAYPDLGGYKKTIAAGYRMDWRDPIGLSNLNIFIAVSPWSNYETKQKIHAMLEWKYWNWQLTANYNKTHFYDIFGPTRRSRAGYSIGLDYKKDNSLKSPKKSWYSFGVHTYGDLEVLPQYQNVGTPIRSMQAATISYGISKFRKSLGGVMEEKGYSWEISSTQYLAQKKFYPSVVSSQDAGFLIPFIRNSSFWIRNSIGLSFGKRSSGLSHFYFGGFRNNYVDWQPSEQYRNVLAFPGAEIDEVPAYNYVKTMGELNLRPIRLNNVGTTWLYPTFIKTALFTTHLMTDFDKSDKIRHLFNLGAQLDIQVVAFSYLKTTWSVGYARRFEKGFGGKDQIMLSLKLLGD
ncbi:MAG: hypothetical protein PHT25_00065 [Bacteroidales bacterium]|nr:hypothetical protein [Bacteroidales bacterium]